jgi:hypothetical protein
MKIVYILDYIGILNDFFWRSLRLRLNYPIDISDKDCRMENAHPMYMLIILVFR